MTLRQYSYNSFELALKHSNDNLLTEKNSISEPPNEQATQRYRTQKLEVCANLGSLDVALLSLLEVDYVPDGVEVVWLDVLVLEVESVLPNVNADDGSVGWNK